MPSLLDCHVAEQTWLTKAAQRNGAAIAPCRNGSNGGPTEIADAGSWEPTIVKLLEFQHWGDDWDGQGARAPSAEMVASAIALLDVLASCGMDPPTATAPGLEGEIVFEWHTPNGTFCEIEITRPFYAEVMLIEPGKPARHWALPTE